MEGFGAGPGACRIAPFMKASHCSFSANHFLSDLLKKNQSAADLPLSELYERPNSKNAFKNWRTWDSLMCSQAMLRFLQNTMKALNSLR